MSIFQEIMERSNSNYVVRKAKSLDKQFRLGSEADLLKAIDLAYVCYVIGEVDFSLKLVDLLSEIEFTGDYRIWEPVRSGLYLQSAIYKERNENELAKKCIERITLALEQTSPISRKIFERTLNGQMVPGAYEKVENAKDEKSECTWRMRLFGDLIKIREMGGGEDFSVERANKEIEENLVRLRVLAEKIYK